MIRFTFLFVFLLILLFVTELTNEVQISIVIPFTEWLARLCSKIIGIFDQHVIFQGVNIVSSQNGFSVSIQAGCNGIEASIALISGILAFPANYFAKILGLCIGTISIQILNILRIISLFYLGQWNIDAFEWAHLYIWQTLIMIDVLIVFLVWLKFNKYLQEKAKI